MLGNRDRAHHSIALAALRQDDLLHHRQPSEHRHVYDRIDQPCYAHDSTYRPARHSMVTPSFIGCEDADVRDEEVVDGLIFCWLGDNTAFAVVRGCEYVDGTSPHGVPSCSNGVRAADMLVSSRAEEDAAAAA